MTKLLLITCASERVDEVRGVIEQHGVHAFTEIPEALGAGERGVKLGTRAFPGEVSLLFTVVPESKAEELGRALREFAGRLDREEGMKVFALEAAELV